METKQVRHAVVLEIKHCRIYGANFAGIFLKTLFLYLNVTEMSIGFYGQTGKEYLQRQIKEIRRT